MAVITPDGIVGKIKDVFPLSSQVLLINDHESGAGVILENSRLQGILKGVGRGEVQVTNIMSDEKVDINDLVVTSGGDRIYPKGMPVGRVISVAPDRDNDPFLAIKLKTAADLNRLEEVLVVIKTAEETPAVSTGPTPTRAADIMAQRLPSIPKKADSTLNAPAGDTPAGTGKKKLAVPDTGQHGTVQKDAGAGSVNTTGAGNAPPSSTPNPEGTQPKKPKVQANSPDAAPKATPETKKPDNPETRPR
jgi:rod shape-determining protein MreC